MLHRVRRALGALLDVDPLAPRRVRLDRRAAARDRKLLLRSLTRTQRAQFERWNGFVVRGRSGQYYRITYGTVANVEVLDERGAVCGRLCAGPTGVSIPAVMLAQKLMLETREAEFLRVAARGPGTSFFPFSP